MADAPISLYERRILHEIGEIESKIKELTQEKEALSRQLMKARREAANLSDVHRKNSVNRAMVEMRVLEVLRNAKKPMRTKELFRAAQYVNFELNESTFRTYLHRMKNKNLIRNAKAAGVWALVEASS
jgi:DNA-binding PadR family transcriptional regulator